MKNKQQVLIQEMKTTANPTGVVAYSLQDIANMPLPVYYEKAGRILNVRNQVYHDTAIYAPRTADGVYGTNDPGISPANRARLFTKGKGQEDRVVNSNSLIIPEKDGFHTNMISDGEFEGGTTFICERIEADVHFTSETPELKDTSYVDKGKIVNTTSAVSPQYSAPVNFFAFTRQFQLTFFRSEQALHNGLLYEFPTRFCASGAFGNVPSGFIQNGPGGFDWNKLERPQVLESEDKFSVLLEPLCNMDTAAWALIRVLLVGRRIGTLYN